MPAFFWISWNSIPSNLVALNDCPTIPSAAPQQQTSNKKNGRVTGFSMKQGHFQQKKNSQKVILSWRVGALEGFFLKQRIHFLIFQCQKNTGFSTGPLLFPPMASRLRFGLGPGNTKANLVLFHARGAVLVSLDELQKVMGGLVIQMIFVDFPDLKNWGWFCGS